MMADGEGGFMERGRQRDWMWSEALSLLAQADRMHRQVFRPAPSHPSSPAWEPPIDMLETADDVLVIAALPGVDAERAQAVIEDGVLVLSGERVLPPELRTAKIHRMELPQGRFERRIPLPAGRYDAAVRRFVNNGCLVVHLKKVAS
jgi:HSP20 family protein